ncbi:winged helix-turn-helix transcriptional regulator [Candidatus Woesearchaeota archaeon]|nr:winged helix-turn-helix transcriptional regulator [Candidatus Woesearchaeota archaeon]
MTKIILDQESFKALAASTRVDILKLLHQKPHTQAELANELGMKPASVNDHLKALLKSALVLQKDEGRKWKYYVLTEKSLGILEPERKQIWITLAVLIFSFIGSVLSYLKDLFGVHEFSSAQIAGEELTKDAYNANIILPQQAEYASKASSEAINYASEAGQSAIQKSEVLRQEPNYLLWFFAGLMLISLVVLLFLWYKKLTKK